MINIFYCVDNKLFVQQVLSLMSLVKYCNEPINVINLTVEVPEYNKNGKATTKEQTHFCNKILKSVNKNSTYTTIDVSDLFRKHLLGGVNVNNKYYSYYVTVRLLADLVEGIPDKVLYLDSDVLFNGNVAELYNINIDDCEIAGRRDAGRITPYFQSGVMLMNMKKIRETGLLRRACELCKKRYYPWYIDMTALNTACKKRKIIAEKYNSYKPSKNCIVHHVCATRLSKVPFSKNWFHRVKTDEIELMERIHPMYKPLYDEYRTIKNQPENEKLFANK